jgi:hypothetical protein
MNQNYTYRQAHGSTYESGTRTTPTDRHTALHRSQEPELHLPTGTRLYIGVKKPNYTYRQADGSTFESGTRTTPTKGHYIMNRYEEVDVEIDVRRILNIVNIIHHFGKTHSK